MHAFTQYLRTLFGRRFGEHDLVAIFSVHLDETGTDGRSPIIVLGGAVAAASQWGKLEAAWERLLISRNVRAYHWKEFTDRHGDFKGWSDFKCKRFIDMQEKIIENTTLFRVSVGVEKAIHADIKKRMKGIKGFTATSDYGLCLQWLMFAASEQLLKVDANHRLSILVEDGPWAAGAGATYQRVARMTGKWKPARHAHRLAGFGTAPKGKYRSLEAADYIAASEHARLIAGKRPSRGVQVLSVLLSEPLLERWYDGMIKEKEHRCAYGQRKPKKDSLLEGEPS